MNTIFRQSKTTAKKISYRIGKAIGFFLKYRAFLIIYNFLFENCPHILVNFFVKFVPLPPINYLWKIKLVNGKIVRTHIDKNDKKTAQFALSYKWHSRAINKVEYLINNYFPEEVPWIDVGSNLGLRSLLPLSVSRHVFFIEPNADLNRINHQRCLLNNFKGFVFIQAGASDKTGETEFIIDTTSYKSTIETNILLNSDEIARKETIKIDTLDNLLQPYINNYTTAYIKIDVEGHELKTLNGAQKTIQQLKPVMLVEVNDKGGHFDNFIGFANQHNYLVFETGYYEKNKIVKKVDIQTKSTRRILHNDFLMIHKEHIDLIEIFKKHEAR
ncbi:MAG: FkbM family methyltransferase [Bacteroidales bacterium]|nr:FkbM family methyltransferase [Bacteroidales bacterium]